MLISSSTFHVVSIAAALMVGCSAVASAQTKQYDVGATDTEIKIGNIMPYSGPASAFSILGKAEAAYFKKINDEGGINGRKINFVSYDDSYSPAKTVEQARRLVESDEVLLLFSPLGTASNTAIQRYLNTRKIPQLFVGSGASKWNNPAEYPWTIGLAPSYLSEGKAYARFLLKEHSDSKIAVIYQNDDFGKDFLNGLKQGLGDKLATMIVASEGYEITEPTVDSRVVTLKASGASVLVNISSPKFAAQVIKKTNELSWKPVHIIVSISASIETVMKPAGIETAQGIISATYVKDPADPQWKDDAEVKEYDQFLAKYYPEAGRSDVLIGAGYMTAQALVHVLRQAGNNLTRENVMKQAASMQNVHAKMLLPGISINTSATNYAPIQQMRLIKLTGDRWEIFGDVINTSDAK
ncbi:ABC transporter substrate-binding protein [Bradyrhizobium sp. G127]|uniref:ABC transporter substrate-binding protein n=1 Tax=Bradyrhizobium sp. G127 TaxID=2904800 RepID=UPI001F375301|nr:ABC transporter substrate-binding protein [Bradyrhizobium sp. G127]MCF2521824.1 ABC transporter substrate-binding protein [Bradyrhizobium sp. G127]